VRWLALSHLGSGKQAKSDEGKPFQALLVAL